MNYAWAGAPTGQTSAHAPHSVQVSGSITNLPSPSEIALTGQPAAHAPQEMHSSLIAYAKGNTSIKFYKPILTQNTKKATVYWWFGKIFIGFHRPLCRYSRELLWRNNYRWNSKTGRKKAYLLTLWHNPTPPASPHLSISNGAKGWNLRQPSRKASLAFFYRKKTDNGVYSHKYSIYQ